ncbi:MAG: hypothetical protein C0598_05560 [Marinilabiliales bacterium]|nr:MAG: hypothetical protein C0598_05560 [Marinilabiliales bacterium]
MKKYFIALVSLVFVVNIQAQKIKLVDGDLNFLKGQDKIGVKFTYDENLKVGPGTEAQYINKKMAAAEEGEAGSGEKWKEAWYSDRTIHYQPKFMELFEKVLEKKDVLLLDNGEPSTYTMIVNTTFIEPGFNIGISSKRASVDMTVTFVETANPDKEMAKFLIKRSPGTATYDAGSRVGESYAKAAKYFAKYLLKEKAF